MEFHGVDRGAAGREHGPARVGGALDARAARSTPLGLLFARAAVHHDRRPHRARSIPLARRVV